MQRPPDTASNRILMLVLAYLWPLALVPLVMARGDADVQWHARNGLALMVAELLVLLALGLAVLSGIAILSVFMIGSAAILMSIVGVLAVHAFAMIRAINGGRLHVPIVTAIVNRTPTR